LLFSTTMRNTSLDNSNNEPGQRSIAHEATGDAEESPVTTDRPNRHPAGQPVTASKIVPEPAEDVIIVKDETDDGGPLIIKSADPDLKDLDLPKIEFPGQGVPEEGRSA
jgi:hypothetical protein